MIKQTLFFTTPVSLSLRNCQMVITQRESDEPTTRPIEDIGCVVLENQQIHITLPLLNELVHNNVAVVLCDKCMMPSAMLMSLDANTTQAETQKLQFAATEPMKKQVWRQIIEQKIDNQARLLLKIGRQADDIKTLSQNVKSGDSDNREGAAARIYWQRLFGFDFRRERDGPMPNAMLNYGYSILRAAVARALLGSGLMPSVGVFHRNRYNAFPLADDVMEPYRPYVDEIVNEMLDDGLTQLDKEAKARLLNVLTADVAMDNVTRPLLIALTMTSASIAKYFAGETKRIALPEFR